MSHELFYTSAPRGLQPGSSGFCTVAATRGLSPLLVEKLEGLSGYRPLYPPHDPAAARNPVASSHLIVTLQDRTYHVLSRVCSAGLDHTKRTNKFAHHVVLEASELPAGGPAWLLRRSGFMDTAWDGAVKQLPAGRVPPKGDSPPAPCAAWQEWTGDAGWAGVLTETFLTQPQRSVYLLYDAGRDPLPLIAEALALLPPEQRWQATFTTYFANLPSWAVCAWRCVPREAAEAAEVRKMPGALVLDLARDMGSARGAGLVEGARTGKPTSMPAPASAAAPFLASRLPANNLASPAGTRKPPPVAAARPGAPVPVTEALAEQMPQSDGVQSRAPERVALKIAWIAGIVGFLMPTVIAAFVYFASLNPKIIALRDEVGDLKERLAQQETNHTSSSEQQQSDYKDLKKLFGKLTDEKAASDKEAAALKKDKTTLEVELQKSQTAKANFEKQLGDAKRDLENERKNVKSDGTEANLLRQALKNFAPTKSLVMQFRESDNFRNSKDWAKDLEAWYGQQMKAEIQIKSHLDSAKERYEAMTVKHRAFSLAKNDVEALNDIKSSIKRIKEPWDTFRFTEDLQYSSQSQEANAFKNNAMTWLNRKGLNNLWPGK